MATLKKDLVFGLRILHRSPWFTAVVVLTLGLGIAVNATVFSWIDSVLLHPFPGVGNAGRLALIETVTPAGENLAANSYFDYLDYRRNLKLVSGIAVGRFTPLAMGPEGKTVRAWAELVSDNFFDVLQVKPVLGRAFQPDEVRSEGGAAVAVISYGTWQKRYSGDPNVLGKTIRLNRHELTIIGVAPRGFHGSLAGVVFDAWAPSTMATAMGTGHGTLHYRATRDQTSTIIRLKPGVTIEQARAEVTALGKRLAEMHPDTNRGFDLTVVPLWKGHLGAQGLLLQPLRILMALSALLLLIVCANVANLLLSRAVTRQKEFGIRLALGAARRRIAGQLLIETLLLALGGAMVGVILLLWMGPALLYMLPTNLPLDLGGDLNLPTLGFTMFLVLAATLLSGLVPALLTVRSNLIGSLNEGGRGGIGGLLSHRLRNALVVAEMTLVMVTLVGAGLFYESFHNASAIRPGFDSANISVSQYYLSYAGYSAKEQWDFCRTLRQRLQTAPGILGVSYSDVIPMSTSSGLGTTPVHKVEIPGYVPALNEQMLIHRATVSPGYFDLLGIPMLRGRDFTERDDENSPRVMIVNQTFANRFYRGADPVGRNVQCEGGTFRIVGLVKDSKYHSPVEGPTPFFYLPFRQWFAPGLNFAVFIKAAGDPLRFTSLLRRESLAINQDASCSTSTLVEANQRSLFQQYTAASLLTFVAAISLLLGAIGLYSVMSYAVSQRTQEMGIRMALGARPRNLLGMVLQLAFRLTVPGWICGAWLSFAAARLVRGVLVNVSLSDPLIFLAAALCLAVVSALASYVPAWRAMHVDPAVALRNL